MLRHLDVISTTGKTSRFLPEETGPIQLYQQLHDYELWPNTFNARPAEVFRLNPFDHTLMDERIQRMWFDQIKIEGSGLPNIILLQAWRWLTGSERYMTNGQGPDFRRDYIQGKRMNEPLPGIFPIGLGGNVYRGIVEIHTGVRSLRVLTLTPSMVFPPDLSHAIYPWFIHYGTVSTTKILGDGSYLVNPFSTFYWQGRNAPSPLIASEPVWLELDTLRILPPGAPAPSCYNPPR